MFKLHDCYEGVSVGTGSWLPESGIEEASVGKSRDDVPL